MSDRVVPFGRSAVAALLAFGLAVGSAAIIRPAHAEAQLGQDNFEPFPSMVQPYADKVLINSVTKVGDHLVAVGSWGHILISSDEGKNWRQVQSPVNVTFTSVRFVDDKLGFITGHDAVILRTEDGGETWALVEYDPQLESPLFDVFMSNDKSGFAIGAYSLVVVTEDGGKTWTTKTMGDLDFHMNALTQAKDGKVWIAGEAGHVFVTDPQLSELKVIETPYSGSFWNVLALDDGSVLVMGLRGNVWRTADQGETWSQSETGTISSIQAGRVLKDGRVLLVGLEGTVLISKDGGKSFERVAREDRNALATAYETSDGKILLFGETGVAGALTN